MTDDRESTEAEAIASAILGGLTAEEADALRGNFGLVVEAVLDEQARRRVTATGGLIEPMILTTVAVEFVREWTDRGNNEWVTIKFPVRDMTAKDNIAEFEVDVSPERLIEFTEERRYRRLR